MLESHTRHDQVRYEAQGLSEYGCSIYEASSHAFLLAASEDCITGHGRLLEAGIPHR